jgi:hypothetical protein
MLISDAEAGPQTQALVLEVRGARSATDHYRTASIDAYLAASPSGDGFDIVLTRSAARRWSRPAS